MTCNNIQCMPFHQLTPGQGVGLYPSKTQNEIPRVVSRNACVHMCM